MERKPGARDKGGFSLVEMLVVLTIMGILSALTVSSIASLRSTALSSAGNQLVDVFAMARQNSISKNCFTAVIIRTQGTGACAAYSLVQSSRDETTGVFGAWTEVTPWRYLPNGIVFENSSTNGDTFMTVATALPGTLPTSANLQGAQIAFGTAGNVVQCYQPDGTLVGGQALKLRLIEGTSDNSGNIVSVGSNYYDLYFIANTGTTKIGRL